MTSANPAPDPAISPSGSAPMVVVVAPPGDAPTVISAFRLGWALTELRGRYDPDFDHVADPLRQLPARPQHALPLGNEREAGELKVELDRVLVGIAEQLGVARFGRRESMPGRLREYEEHLDRDPTDRAAWTALAGVFYSWDAKIQDALSLRPSEAAAYQLGRGLADVYWDLDPSAADGEWRSWEFLLGDARRTTIKRLLARLSPYMESLTDAAVRLSLDAWGEVAADEKWRSVPDCRSDLYDQARLWRELIRGERDPESLIAPNESRWQLGRTLRAFVAFWPQLLFGVLGIAVLLAGALVISNKTLGVVATAAGGLGVTSATLYARAKSSAQRLFSRARAGVYEDLIGDAATRRPRNPHAVRTALARAPLIPYDGPGEKKTT